MHITPGIASRQEVKGVHFSKWGEGNSGTLWGEVLDMVKSMEAAPCACRDFFENCLSLRSELHLAIFRHPTQWRSAFLSKVAPLLEGNAQATLWHSDGAKEEAVQNMMEELGNLCVRIPDFADGQTDRVPFFDPPTIELMRHAVCEAVHHHEFKPPRVTNLEEEVVAKAKQELQQLGMVGGGLE